MRLFFHFRNIKPSKKIKKELEARAERLSKFEWKPVSCDITLKLEAGVARVEMQTTGNGSVLRASGEGSDFYEAFDASANKLERQLVKKKAKVKNHKCYERTHYGKLDQLDAGLSMAGDAPSEEAA